MKRLAVGLAAALSLCAGGVGPAAAQAIPGGSYQQSCNNVRMRGDVLRATCSNANGGTSRTSINVNACRGGDIANSNGQLVCSGGYGNGYGNGYGYGYGNGNGNGNAYGHRHKHHRHHHDNDNDNDDRDRGNNGYGNNGYGNGRYGGGYNGAVPGGSYQQSCTNAYVRGGILTATCTRANGSSITTSINAARCNGSDIANVNGRLECR